MANNIAFSWSSGKDAAMSLHRLIVSGTRPIKLLTSVNEHYGRVSMHGVRETLLHAQADSIGIPLEILYLPENPTMETYDGLMESKLRELKDLGITEIGYGDIFLEDLKTYRNKALVSVGLSGTYPIWKEDTRELIQYFFDLGFKSKIVCINNSLLDESFLGADITPELIDRLPMNVDPCGENGEFHTFCYDGPIFKEPVKFHQGEKTWKHYNDPSGKGNDIRFGFVDLVESD